MFNVMMMMMMYTVTEIATRCESSLDVEGGEEDEAEMPEGLAHLDGDTAISKRSFDAALCAAGSLCQAVDMVRFSLLLCFLYYCAALSFVV